MNVDEFVATRVLPEYRPVVTMLRELLREMAPDAEELMYYGLPMYRRGNMVFAWISPSKTGINLGFQAGATFEDTYGLLGGKGKWARNIHIASVDAVPRDVLRYYIRQALESDAK